MMLRVDAVNDEESECSQHIMSRFWVTVHFLESILSHVSYVTLCFSILVDRESRHICDTLF